MKMPSKSKVNLGDITGPYPLLGLLLLVTEGLLGYWLFRAGSATERGFTGFVMVLILFGVLYATIRIKREETGALASLSVGATSIKPPEKEATASELAAPAPDTMPGPDRSYLINLPPQGWRVKECTQSEWISGGLGVEDPQAKEKLFPSAGQSRDILIFEREEQTSVIPVPGRTTIDGRKIPTALETVVPTQLSIHPLARAQPPFFVEHSLEHNFLIFVGQILNLGVVTATHLEVGLIRASGRPYLACELHQKVQDAIVNGKEGQDVEVTFNVIGIHGELRDHILLTKYASVPGDRELEHSLQTLRGLVASFRPLRVVNAEEKRREMAALADENFKKLLNEKGEDFFIAEFGILLLRLKGVSLDDPELRARVMKLLRPFEAFPREIHLQDQELDSFWDALHSAETGDATAFKVRLNEMTQLVARQQEEKQAEAAALPPRAAGTGN